MSQPRPPRPADRPGSCRRAFLYYGPAPFVIAAVALLTGLILLGARSAPRARPDLILVTFARDHVEGHERAAEQFYKDTGKRVEIQLTDARALLSRLQASLGSGAAVPDMVEIVEPNMGTFTRGPLEDVGFLDLTEKLRAGGWYDKLVPSRFSLWSSRGHVFAIPHDVHPVMLAYRRDLVEAEGIDVNTLTTWDEFAKVARQIVAKHARPDGNSDRYMLDVPAGGAGLFSLMLLQNGVNAIDAEGNVAFDTPAAAQVIGWYVRAAVSSPTSPKIGFDAGWGQNLSQALSDGLILFIACPDWRTRNIQLDMPNLSGKLALMPLPAWQPGGRRTSVWGGTGLAIPKRSRDPELAWKFATYAYYEKSYLPDRFASNNILPPLKGGLGPDSLDVPDPYYSNQPRGRLYANLAAETPPRHVNAFTPLAESKLSEALVNSIAFYRSNGQNGLDAFIQSELTRTAGQVRRQIARNVFLSPAAQPQTTTKGGAK